MDTYSLLREIADSWVLLAMFCFFVGVGIWAFLPALSDARAEASMIPLREDTDAAKCAGSCETCPCKTIAVQLEGQHHV